VSVRLWEIERAEKGTEASWLNGESERVRAERQVRQATKKTSKSQAWRRW